MYPCRQLWCERSALGVEVSGLMRDCVCVPLMYIYAHMSRFAVTIPRNPTGPILHTITKLHCYCKHSVLCIG